MLLDDPALLKNGTALRGQVASFQRVHGTPMRLLELFLEACAQLKIALW